MLFLWSAAVFADIFTWLVVYSNYQELSDITRLEDMAKLKMSTLSSLNASRSFSHHSLDSANAYGRYGGQSGPSQSLQASPQIYHHGHHQQPQPGPSAMAIHESHQNLGLHSADPSYSGMGGGRNQSQPQSRGIGSHQQQQIKGTPLSSSQNSLHANYLQMYSSTLSQRSRHSSQNSLQSQNAFPMTTYNQTGGLGTGSSPSTHMATNFTQNQPAQHQTRQTQQQQPSYGAYRSNFV